MNKISIILIMALFMIIGIKAVSLDNVTLNATGINTIVTINNEINVSSVIIGSNSIYFQGLNGTNATAQIQAGESISFNITVANKTYTDLSLPHYTSSSGMAKQIMSSIDQDINGSVIFSVVTCTLSAVYFDTYGVVYDKTYSAGEWSCTDNFLTVNYTGLHTGISHFYAYANVIASACEIGNENASLYFSIFDENFPINLLNATAEVEFNYWVSDTPQYIQNFTVEFSGNNTYGLCLHTNETPLNTDLYIKYTTDNGFTHRYILANNTLTAGSPQNYSLYNFNTTTGISDLKITVRRNSNYNYYTNIIGKLQRRYTSEGVWRTVQMDKSGDFGLMFFNIKEENTDYRMIFTDMYNNVLRITESMKFVCSAGICDLTVLLDPYSRAAGATGLNIAYTYTNATGVIDVVWEDTTAATNTVEFKVRQQTITGSQDLCSETQTGSAGTMTCDLSGRTGIVEVNIKGNSEIIYNDLLDLKGIKLGAITGNNEGVVWAVLLMITCVMFGIFSPVGAIIAMMISLIGIYLLGIFTPITITFVMIAAVIGIVIGIKVRE